MQDKGCARSREGEAKRERQRRAERKRKRRTGGETKRKKAFPTQPQLNTAVKHKTKNYN